MNNITVEINNYLQNEMPAEEKKVFEEKLALDPALQQEVFMQQQIIRAVKEAAVRSEFSGRIRRRKRIRRLTRHTIIVVVCILTATLFTFRSSFLRNNVPDTTDSAGIIREAFIKPPLSSANVPFTEYEVDAEKGDTIFHYTGSVLYFPPLAFKNEKGVIVKGKTTIRYREFSDPLDFFVSGIPMDYDSAGNKYQFESAGMCEITAVQDNKPLFVNEAASPVINMSATNPSNLQNLYFLDTVNRRWNFIGKDKMSVLKKSGQKIKTGTYLQPERNGLPTKPVRPQKADEDRQAFSIEIDPGSFEELFVYNNLKMEVIDDKNYKRSDAEEHWDDVKLEHTGDEAVYSITFTNQRRKVSYKVKPVLEGADYDAALKIFNEKNRIYQQAIKDRNAQEKAYGDSIRSLNEANVRKYEQAIKSNDSMNALIIERNKQMRAAYEERIRIGQEQAAQQLEQQIIAMERIKRDFQKYENDGAASTEIIRSFAINRFGIWNIDQPMMRLSQVPLISSYIDEGDQKLYFVNMAVVYKGFNSISNFQATNITVAFNQQNMLWSILNGTFYYFTYDDFIKTNIQKDTRTYTFKMRKSGTAVSSYNDIRKLVDNF